MKTVSLVCSLLVLGMVSPMPAPGRDGSTVDQAKPIVVRKRVGTNHNLSKGLRPRGPNLQLRQDVSLDYSYVGGAKIKSGPDGHLGEQTSAFRYSLKVPVDAQWSFRVGLHYKRFDFSVPEGALLPNNLQTISPSFGVDYRLLDQWSVFGGISPRLSMIDNGDHIGSQDFRVGGILGATYNPSRTLSLQFGVVVNPDSLGSPVLPAVGVRWEFADLWTLNFGFPRTSIDHQLLPNLTLSLIKVGFEGGSFHTSKTYGDAMGRPQLNDRKLQYQEVRVGTGANYAVTESIQVGLTAGAVVYRNFDFKDTAYSQKVDPAPYVQLSVKTDF